MPTGLLEPDASKGASPVLRGPRRRKALGLPDNTVADHIAVLTQAIGPDPGVAPQTHADSCRRRGFSHELFDWLTDDDTKRVRTVEYSVGFATKAKVRDTITKLPNKVWTAATDADGDGREGGDIAEVTALLQLSGCPAGGRLIVHRKRPHPGAQLSLFEEATGGATRSSRPIPGSGSWRFWRRATAHARVEDRIRNAPDSDGTSRSSSPGCGCSP